MHAAPEIPAKWLAGAERAARLGRVAVDQGIGLEEAAFLIQQAIEKALKGFLISTGWELSKTHDLPSLLDTAEEKDSRFGDFTELCERANSYAHARYPAGLDEGVGADDLRADLAGVERMIKLVREIARLQS
jgi:HEPN domain-containing protein